MFIRLSGFELYSRRVPLRKSLLVGQFCAKVSTLTKHKMLLSNLSVENNHDDCFFFFFGVLKNLALFFEFQYPCPSLPSVARDDRKQLRWLNMIQNKNFTIIFGIKLIPSHILAFFVKKNSLK